MFRKPVNANQLKASLIKETGCSDNAAETVLRKTRWNLTNAIKEYNSNMKTYDPGRASSGGGVIDKEIEKFYNTYKYPEGTLIDGDCYEKFLTDLGINIENQLAYLLAWKCQAKNFNQLSKSEFVTGCEAMGAKNITQLRNALPGLTSSIADHKQYKDFMKYVFNYLVDFESKTLKVEYAIELYTILMKPRFPNCTPFLEYLQARLDAKKGDTLSQDDWVQSIDFFKEIKPDFSNFSVDQYWPLLLEHYVAWMNAGKKFK